MKKRVLLVLLFIFLIGCKSQTPAGGEPRDTAAILEQVKVGTRGVEISVVPNYPPPLIYDQNPFLALVEVKNKGNHDLDPQDCFIWMTGYDPNLLGGINNVQSCALGLGTLGGKNVYNLDGESNQVEFSTSNVILPDQVFEYDPLLNFLACYNYETVAAPLICVDPLLYQVTAEQKACTPKDVTMGGGQGGPVGVSYVGVDMVGEKAIFEINIRNFGSGRVVSPSADISQCGRTSIEYQDLDKVEVGQVSLGGGAPINCRPQDKVVRMTNGQGKIICSFTVNGQAYETPLIIQMSYGYIESFQKQIKIIKTPG